MSPLCRLLVAWATLCSVPDAAVALTCAGIARQLQVLVPGLLETNLLASLFRSITLGAATDGQMMLTPVAVPTGATADKGDAKAAAASADRSRFAQSASLLAASGAARLSELGGAADHPLGQDQALLLTGLRRLGLPLLFSEGVIDRGTTTASIAGTASVGIPHSVPHGPDFEEVLRGVATSRGCSCDLGSPEVSLQSFLVIGAVGCISHTDASAAA